MKGPHTPNIPVNSSHSDDLPSASAQAAASYMLNFDNIIAPGKEPVMTKEYKPQVAYRFENFLTPSSLKRHVLRNERIRKIIDLYALESKCSTKEVERQVREIIEEIGLDRNLAIIRWCGMAITAIGKRICSGIYVNSASMNRIKQDLGRNPVLYLPSHRSYMDFILMSYICFHYDIEIPGIAAGMDFHSMFGMGTMLRKTGAFFMRRSFSNDELYWDIFREYMYALVANYHIGVEFFIEGTRSRNFKALVPKVGLFSMALLPYFTGEVPDVTIVPVSISYDRVLEEQLFVYELLGVPKPKESTKGFFKALKIIDENFGRMYVDFGEPISVRKFFAHVNENRMKRATVGAHLQKLNSNEIELVKKLANETIYQQQRRIVITTFNLLSLYLTSQLYMKRSINMEQLSNGIDRLKSIFEELGAHVATNKNSIKPEIIETIEIHSNIVHFVDGKLQLKEIVATQLAQQIDPKRLKGHALTPQTMAVAVPAMTLQLYINPCLFWLARPAYLILAALEVRQEQNKQLSNLNISSTSPSSTSVIQNNYTDLIANLQERVNVLDKIFQHEFIIESNREVEEFKRNLTFLEATGVLSISLHSAQIILHENDTSTIILSALAPFLCIYYQLAVTLNQLSPVLEYSSKEIVTQMQDRIEKLLQERSAKHVHPYCLALDNLNIAIYSLLQHGYLIKNKESGLLKITSKKSLQHFEEQLLRYCQLMPFTQYFDMNAAENVHNQLVLSKL